LPAIGSVLHLALIKASDIDLVIIVGGSTEVPAVQAEFTRLFPAAAVADENKLANAGLGLDYESQYKFGVRQILLVSFPILTKC